MSILPAWLVLLPLAFAPEVGAPTDAGTPRRVWAPAGALAADEQAVLVALASAAERGDRAAFVEQLEPSTRGSSAAMADLLVGTARSPLRDVRIDVTCVSRSSGAVAGCLVVSARDPAAEPRAAAEAGWVAADPTRRAVELAFELARPHGGPRRVRLTRASAAEVVDAQVSLVVELGAPGQATRLTGTTRLLLAARTAGAHEVLLSLPSEGRVVAVTPGLALTPTREGVRAELPTTLAAAGDQTWVELRHEGVAPGGIAGSGDRLHLFAPPVFCPFGEANTYRFDVTIDTPERLLAVSVGNRQELPATPGRRRVRYDCRRLVDVVAVDVAPFTIEREDVGELAFELWRSRDVGGDAAVALGHLRSHVEFQAERVGNLPYDAFRLVELSSGKGLAMSYPSFIVMSPDMLATTAYRREILAHEVGHQWWGNAVQGDASTRWISEGMAEAMRDLTVLHLEGEDAWWARQRSHRAKYVDALGMHARPLAEAPGDGPVVYDRGALFVAALREHAGEETFWRILRTWYAEMAGSRVSTAQLQSAAERVAGHSLSAVFNPWLRATALPVVALEHEVIGGGLVVRGTILQEAPVFPLRVPLGLTLDDGSTEVHEVASNASRAAFELRASRPIAEVTLDPDQRLPAIRDDERRAYLAKDAAASVARGDHARGIALLEDARKSAFLSTDEGLLLAAALELAGRGDESRRLLQDELGLLGEGDERQRAVKGFAQRLLDAGAAGAALPLAADLDAAVVDGAAAPLLHGHVLRALGREAEAEAAFRRALERRPASAEARAALGLEAMQEGRPEAGLVAVFPTEQWKAVESRLDRVTALALGRGRVAIVDGAARRVLAGPVERLAIVPAYSPVGAIDAACVGVGSANPLVVVLEVERTRSRLVILRVGVGAPRVQARHDRCPAGAVAVRGGKDDLVVAWRSETGQLAWHRLATPLSTSTDGPDDRDGLVRLELAKDARFAPVGQTPSVVVAVQDGGAVATALAPGVVEGQGLAWRLPEAEKPRDVAAIATFGAEVVVAVTGDLSSSPLGEDARPAARLHVARGESVRTRALPADVRQVSLAPGGEAVLVRPGAEGAGPLEVEWLAPWAP